MAPFDRNGAPRLRTHRMASQYGMRYEPRMLAAVRAWRPRLFVCTESHASKQARACRRTRASARAFNATAGRTGYVEGCLLNLVRCSCIRRDGWAGGRSPEPARAARAARHRRRASARRRRPRRSARACAAIVRACGVLCACALVGSMTCGRTARWKECTAPPCTAHDVLLQRKPPRGRQAMCGGPVA